MTQSSSSMMMPMRRKIKLSSKKVSSSVKDKAAIAALSAAGGFAGGIALETIKQSHLRKKRKWVAQKCATLCRLFCQICVENKSAAAKQSKILISMAQSGAFDNFDAATMIEFMENYYCCCTNPKLLKYQVRKLRGKLEDVWNT